MEEPLCSLNLMPRETEGREGIETKEHNGS